MMNFPLDHSEQMKQAARFLREGDDFLVVSHVHPDGDAASSTVAVGLMLSSLNKRYTLMNAEQIPRRFSYLPGYSMIYNYSEEASPKKFKTIISVDCADFSRMGNVVELFEEGFTLLNIDHHPTNDFFGQVNLVKPDAAATAEVLHDLIEEMRIPWTEDLAKCIYSGLLTDTGGFRYANTTPRVMNIASKLLSLGVNGQKLAEHLLEKVTYAHILLLQRVLNTLSFTEQNKICWVRVTRKDVLETRAVDEDMEGLVDYPRNIEGVEVGILFKETKENAVKVSLRSNGIVDVAAIAKSFGGGGHILAAGCTVKGSIDEVERKVIEKVKDALR